MIKTSTKLLHLRGILCLSLLGALATDAEQAFPLHPFPGITIRSEVRQQPPTRLFVAEVDLTDPKLRMRVARGGPDPDGPGKWQTTLMRPTQIAAREHFDLVINGDFFHARGVKDAEGPKSRYRSAIWGSVIGPAVTDGKVWSAKTNPTPCLVVRKNSKVSIEMVEQPPVDAWQVIAGNTMLLEDGVVEPHRSTNRHPRTVVGLDAAATKLVLLLVDGRKPGIAVGMSYAELANEMLKLGCARALNLDGGGSSVMAIYEPAKRKYQILNEPTDGRERAVANVLGISARRP